jgi:hypothetical protein
MCARTVSLQLKPNSVAAYTQTMEKDILPLLRTQPGFQDAMVFVVPGGTEAVAINVWDQKEPAEASARGTSPHVLQAVDKVVEGTPQVSTSEVANSTFHTIVPCVATCSGQVVCVRWGRPQPPFLWSGKATWTYLEDPVCLPCVSVRSQRSGPTGLLRVHRGVLWPPRAPAHTEGSPQGRRA